LDYGHGTSHGIGAYLNVHEGPIGIGPRPNAASSSLKPGHLISNEPGYYEDGDYGIRIENVMYVKQSGHSYNERDFLEFDTLTRVPFCKKLIDISLLTTEEKAWINKYHQTVWNELSPSFSKTSLEYIWLKKETAPL
jgi:Xaa-Pro aminopeptidase